MSEVFISYAHERGEREAMLVVEALRAAGYGVWRDDELPPHRPFREVLDERLTAAKAVVVLWSKEAVKSDWVEAEADRARADRKLVQMTLDGSLPPIPFDRIQCVDLTGWAGDVEAPAWKKVAASVGSLVGREAGAPSASTPTTALPLPDKPSIAVLPFTDAGVGAEGDYFADGMVEEIVTALARFSALFVVGSASSLGYRGRPHDVAKIGRELGVRYLLEGSVRRAGARVRIAVNLVEAAGGAQVWADRFEGTLEDVFALQDEVANTVAARIEPSIQAAELRRGAARPTEDLSAYDLFLRGRQRQIELSKEGWSEAVALWEQAVARDPGYALAWASIASSEALAAGYGWSPDPEASRRKAREAIRHASVGSDDPRVLVSIAQASLALGGDPPSAAAMAERALMLNPGSAIIWTGAGVAANLSGNPELGLERLQRALRLDPGAQGRPGIEASIGHALTLLGRFDEALPWLEATATLRPNNTPVLYALAHAYAEVGRSEEARAMLARAEELVPAQRYLASSSTIRALAGPLERRRSAFRDLGADV